MERDGSLHGDILAKLECENARFFHTIMDLFFFHESCYDNTCHKCCFAGLRNIDSIKTITVCFAGGRTPHLNMLYSKYSSSLGRNVIEFCDEYPMSGFLYSKRNLHHKSNISGIEMKYLSWWNWKKVSTCPLISCNLYTKTTSWLDAILHSTG